MQDRGSSSERKKVGTLLRLPSCCRLRSFFVAWLVTPLSTVNGGQRDNRFSLPGQLHGLTG